METRCASNTNGNSFSQFSPSEANHSFKVLMFQAYVHPISGLNIPQSWSETNEITPAGALCFQEEERHLTDGRSVLIYL